MARFSVGVEFTSSSALISELCHSAAGHDWGGFCASTLIGRLITCHDLIVSILSTQP